MIVQSIQGQLRLKTWFDMTRSFDVNQTCHHLNQTFPSLGQNPRRLLMEAIQYGYQRLRPIQDDINALWDRVRCVGPGIIAMNPNIYLPINPATGIRQVPTGIQMEDVLALQYADEARLRVRLAHLAVARYTRELVRSRLYQHFEQRLMAVAAAAQGNGRHGTAVAGTAGGAGEQGGAVGGQANAIAQIAGGAVAQDSGQDVAMGGQDGEASGQAGEDNT